MQLKSIVLHGFKSFPDKTVIEFDRGITAVVGPNGSGKSNVSDAVKWALGEQSNKQMRSKKMDDVIFSGTQKRKAMGYALVTLTFDNKERKFPYDTDEVAVTRKLYKTGDSEYLINGMNVRLRDVQEMFMDTGLGKDGYSIIGQGKIAEIVGAKSNERREIFEEAAGISKFRYRKQDAERKLSAAEDNILRLKDISTELEQRIGPLKTQSEKAKIFLAVSEEKKALDVSISVHKLKGHKDALSALEEKLNASISEESKIDEELALIEQKSNKAYEDNQRYAIEIEELRNILSTAEHFVSESTAKIAILGNDIEHNNANLARMKEQNSDEVALLSEFDNKISELNAKISAVAKLNVELDNELDSVNEELTKINSEAEESDRQKQSLTERLNNIYISQSEMKIAIQNAKDSIESFKENLKSLSEKSQEITAKRDEFSTELNGYKAEKEKASSLKQENQNKINGYTALLSGKQAKLHELEDKYDKQFFEISSIREKISILSEVERNMDGYQSSVKEVINAKKNGRISGIHGTVGQLISTENEYSTAIETALGAALQNIVVDNEEVAKRAIYFLKDNRLGRATFLPLTSIKARTFDEKNLDRFEGFIGLASELVQYDKKYDNVVKSLLGRIVIVEDINCATTIAKQCGYRFRIVTLDGQIINAGGSFTGGSLVKSAGVLTRRHKLEELNEKLNKLTAENDELSDKLDALREECQKLSLETEGIKEVISKCEIDEMKFDGEISRVDSLIEQLDNILSENEASINDANTQIETAKATIEEKQRAIFESEAESETLKNEIQSSDDTKSETLRNAERLSTRSYELRMRRLENNKDIDSFKFQIDDYTQRKQSVLDSSAEFASQVNAIETENKQKQSEIEELKIAVQNANITIVESNDKVSELHAKRNEAEKLANDLRADEKQALTNKQVFAAETARLTERNEAMQREYDNIISSLWEEYQLTKSEAYEIAEPVEDLKDAISKQNKLKQKIKSLGSVNVAAIEEYKEVSERYEFLSHQLNDVYKSKAELEEIIADMTKNICEKFKVSFDIINENFKKIFVELFGGGKGELILTEPDNLLESGIEIVVSPPGKVIKNLSSLSGGEQAFVAIAIYFAILKYNPSPFCILDEIEAALDDVNVGIYAQYLRMFTGTTQFILITHRRPTMEEADILYGVTMQEKGVSKLLKMDAREAANLEKQVN